MDRRLAEDARALAAGRLSRAQFIRRGLAAGVSVTVLGSVLAACGGESASGGGAATDVATGAAPTPSGKPPATPTGTLVYGNAEPPTANYWDPAAGFGLVDEQVASLVHDTLLAHDADGNVHPQLAERTERIDDRTVRVTLRSGVRFQDGTELTAADVAATFDRLGARDSRLAQSNTVSPLRCKVRSPTSLDIVTDKPFGPMEAALAYVKILPKSDIDHPANFRRRALGAGPYRFVSYEGNTVTLAANDDYWGEKPHAAEIRFEYIEDLEARTNALLTGDIQIMSRVGSEQLARVKGNGDYYTTRTSPPSQVCSLYQHNGVLRDTEIRQAIAHAVDREAIARGILKGVFPVGQSSLPTTSPMYEALDTRFPYDPEKARALLRGRKVELRMATATLFSHQVEIDQAIAQYLEAVGMTVKLTKLEVGAFRTSYNQYDLSLNTLGSFTGDPDFIFGFYAGGTGEAVFHLDDPRVVELLDAQRQAVGDARPPKVTDMAAYLWDQQTTLYLTDEIWYFIVSSDVQNYQRAPLIGEPLAAKAWLAAA